MVRKVNVKIQMHQRIDSLLAIGESKHYAKQVYRDKCKEQNIKWNPSKTPFIHSTTSADNYRQVVNQFSTWLKENKSDVWSTKDLNSLTKEVCYDYLKYRDENYAATTVSRDMSALNKVLDHDLNKKDANLSQRSYKDITRSRTVKAHHSKYNPANYRPQIEFARAFGVRRESVIGGDYQVKEISLFKSNENGHVYACVIEKGGRYREAPCLEKYQAAIEARYNIQEREIVPGSKGADKENYHISENDFKKLYNSNNDKYLFDKYTTKINSYASRHSYAKELYKENADKLDNLKADYRSKFDTRAVQMVSNALGHSRISDTITYLR